MAGFTTFEDIIKRRRVRGVAYWVAIDPKTKRIITQRKIKGSGLPSKQAAIDQFKQTGTFFQTITRESKTFTKVRQEERLRQIKARKGVIDKKPTNIPQRPKGKNTRSQYVIQAHYQPKDFSKPVTIYGVSQIFEESPIINRNVAKAREQAINLLIRQAAGVKTGTKREGGDWYNEVPDMDVIEDITIISEGWRTYRKIR